MAKKGGGAPAWMATFADLMSLLLTLFVLLLTFAEMDVIKYKAISGSMSEAFGVSKKDKLSGVVEIDGTIRRKAAKDVDVSNREEEITKVPTVSMEIPEISEEEIKERAQNARDEKAEELKESLVSTMEPEIKNVGVTVDRIDDKVIIRFPSEIAFPSGSGALNNEFEKLLDRLAPVLKDTPGELIVSGHTDDLPVRSGAFQSNWDLSASRATSVVHRFLFEHLLDPTRVTVQGFGDSRPIASNETPEGRAKNRRVEITILTPDNTDDTKPKTGANTQSGTGSKGFYDE